MEVGGLWMYLNVSRLPDRVGSFRATVILETYRVICIPPRKVKPYAVGSCGSFWRLAVHWGKISMQPG